MPAPTGSPKQILLQKLYDAGVYKFGEFHLKSGQFTPIYIDLRGLISNPSLFKTVIDSMWNTIQENGLKRDCLCGVPQAAVPLATGLMMNHNVPMILQRKEAKSYGTKKLIEGHFQENQTCLIIEDVTVLAWSIEESVKTLRDQKLTVTDAVTLVDRQQGAVENLAKLGIKLHCTLKLDDILEFLVGKSEITSKRAKEIKDILADESYMDKNGK